MQFTYQHNGQNYNLNLIRQPDGQYSITLGERTFPVAIQQLPDNGWRMVINGESHVVYTAAQGDQRFVQVGTENYTLTVPNKKSTRRKTASAGDELTAQMPGQVTAVLVKAGDEVSRGQTLLILEAMKMEIRVTAPVDGRIQEVLLQMGAVVERGQRLILFETSP